MRLTAQQLADAWRQCQRHAHHLRHAMASLEDKLPLAGSQLATLDDEAVWKSVSSGSGFGRSLTASPMTTRTTPTRMPRCSSWLG